MKIYIHIRTRCVHGNCSPLPVEVHQRDLVKQLDSLSQLKEGDTGRRFVGEGLVVYL